MNLRTVLPPVLVAVLGLGALSGVQDTGFREHIESQLTERAHGALSAAGLDGVRVEITGRDADVTAPTDADALAAAGVVSGVEGVRAAVAYGPEGRVTAGAGPASATVPESAPEETAGEDAAGSAAADDPSPAPTASPGADGPEAEPAREPTRREREKAQEDLVEIPNITFVTDSARLTRDGRRVVRDAAEVLAEHPEVDVRIEGHTDSVGTRAHNQRLSERRADRVLDRLVELGVDPDRLSSRGFGESDPLVVPRTFADRETNRRVEFVVLD
jgi:outer membrane protein OmpA-like peptidoglycan-associated protein